MIQIMEEEFSKIYYEGLKRCKILCVNRNRRMAIENYKIFKDESSEDILSALKENIKKETHEKCWECSCRPDEVYMLSLINKLIKNKSLEERKEKEK